MNPAEIIMHEMQGKGRVRNGSTFLFWIPNGEVNENVWGRWGRIAEYTYKAPRFANVKDDDFRL